MIQKVGSLVISDIILNIIMNDDRAVDYTAIVKTFNNGREQGYTILSKDYSNKNAIAFGQDRNSDMIVVYKGVVNGNIPSCRGKNGSRDFPPESYNIVVDYIFELLEKINK